MLVKVCDISVKSVSWFSNPIEFEFLEFGSEYNKEPRIKIMLVDSEARDSRSTYALKDIAYYEIYDAGTLIDRWTNPEFEDVEDYEDDYEEEYYLDGTAKNS